MKYESCLELVKEERSRNFQILIRSEHYFFMKKAVEAFQELFAASTCNHKLAVINPGTAEEVGRQIYFTLLGGLNLACVFSNDGLLKTFGIQIEKYEDPELSSSLISTFHEPVPVELANVQPIILDMNRCGVLKAATYFSAREFGTCIAQVLFPGAHKWKLSYLIQCDRDTVKICPIDEEQEEQAQPIPTGNYSTSVPLSSSKSTRFEDSVLNDQNYSFCRNLINLISAVKEAPASDLKPANTFIKEINLLLKFIKKNRPDIFPGIEDEFEIKKRYAKLCKELESEIIGFKGQKRTELVKDILKKVRQQINFINISLKREANGKIPDESTQKIDWLINARAFSSSNSRTSKDQSKAKSLRLEREKKDGIIMMPLLEPYLDVKWPSTIPKPPIHEHPVIQAYSDRLALREKELQIFKQFGI